MEIDLTYIFTAILVLGVFTLVFMVVLLNKVKSLDGNFVSLNSSSNEEMKKEISELSNSLQKAMSSSDQEKSLMLDNILKSISVLGNTFSENTLSIQKLISDNYELQIQAITSSQNVLNEAQEKQISNATSAMSINISECQIAIEKELKATASSIQKLIKDDSQLQIKDNQNNQKLLIESNASQLSETAKVLRNKVNESQLAIEKELKTITYINKQEQLATVEQLTSQIQTLRVGNLVELTNELSKQQDLIIDNTDFIKHLGDCKVVKIIDKHSGQVTQVYYEDGVKQSSDTFAGENLKYQMFYTPEGKADKGVELDERGNVIFEYLYDGAGEISKRTESTYDENNNETNKVEKSY